MVKPRAKLSKAQMFFGILFVVLGLLGLSHTFDAFAHHNIVWSGGRWPNRTWMYPGQAAAAFTLFVALGVYFLVDAFQRRRKRDSESDSAATPTI